METKQKTVTVEIPEGKKAVWNEQGILQLVDDDKEPNEQKPITERIKTLYDVPCGDREFQQKISDLCSEQRFKELTNPFYFTSQSKDYQRKALIAMAGDALSEGCLWSLELC